MASVNPNEGTYHDYTFAPVVYKSTGNKRIVPVPQGDINVALTILASKGEVPSGTEIAKLDNDPSKVKAKFITLPKEKRTVDHPETPDDTHKQQLTGIEKSLKSVVKLQSKIIEPVEVESDVELEVKRKDMRDRAIWNYLDPIVAQSLGSANPTSRLTDYEKSMLMVYFSRILGTEEPQQRERESIVEQFKGNATIMAVMFAMENVAKNMHKNRGPTGGISDLMREMNEPFIGRRREFPRDVDLREITPDKDTIERDKKEKSALEKDEKTLALKQRLLENEVRVGSEKAVWNYLDPLIGAYYLDHLKKTNPDKTEDELVQELTIPSLRLSSREKELLTQHFSKILNAREDVWGEELEIAQLMGKFEYLHNLETGNRSGTPHPEKALLLATLRVMEEVADGFRLTRGKAA